MLPARSEEGKNIRAVSCQFRLTLHIKRREKKKNLFGWELITMVSPGILAPRRWSSLIRVGAHPRVPGIIKHWDFFFFFFKNCAPGNCGKDSEVIFIKRLEASFSVQTVFQLLSSTFMTSFVWIVLGQGLTSGASSADDE